MRKISIILLLTLVLNLMGCAAQPETNSTPASSIPSEEKPLDTTWHHSIKLDTGAKWSLSVVETDTHFYYIAADGVYQHQKETAQSSKLVPETAYGLYLYENNLYYHTQHEVKCVDLHTQSVSVIWNEAMLENQDTYYLSINDFALLDGYLYIAGTGTSVMRVNLADYAAEQFLGDCGSMVLLANNCYYLDHAERTFSLYRMTCDTKESILLRGDGKSYPENMRIDGIAGTENTVAYSVRDGADVYLYDPSGNDEKIFDGDDSGELWLTLVPQWTGNKLYFYTTDGSQFKLYEYQSETGVSLLTSFDCTTRLCDIAITESAVFWWSEEESSVKCIRRKSTL